MAQNVFDATFDANNRIDVNSFDWSHVNNLTTNFGRITPVFCELVPAKGSLRINPEFGLELMPMVFPVQTRMFARLNFFKVTLRSMWEDYSDFISNFRDDLEEPYILPDKFRFDRMLKTNTLGDYLGIPTQRTTLKETQTGSITRCAPTGGSNDVGLYFIGPTESWDSIFSQWNGSYSTISSISCGNVSPRLGSTVFLTSSTKFPIGLYESATLLCKLTTTAKFGDLPCRIMIYHTTSKSKFYIDSQFTVSDDGKSANLTAPLGSIKQRLNVTDNSKDCLIAILAPASGLDFSTTALSPGPLTVYSDSELSEVTYDAYPFETFTTFTGHPTVDHPRLLAYRFRAYESVYTIPS